VESVEPCSDDTVVDLLTKTDFTVAVVVAAGVVDVLVVVVLVVVGGTV